MTNYELLLEQINNSEAACKLYLQECRKLKKMLVGEYPLRTKNGPTFTPEMSARVIAKRRMNVLGKLK